MQGNFATGSSLSAPGRYCASLASRYSCIIYGPSFPASEQTDGNSPTCTKIQSIATQNAHWYSTGNLRGRRSYSRCHDFPTSMTAPDNQSFKELTSARQTRSSQYSSPQSHWTLPRCGENQPSSPHTFLEPPSPWSCVTTVSYTHLTLPTKRIV